MNAIRGRLCTQGKLVTGTLRWTGERIDAVELEGEIGGNDLPIIAPGLIDLHVHGFGGFDPLSDLAGMARALARAGTTTFQPTLFPAAPSRLGEQARRVTASAAKLDPKHGARFLGVHLEGPFVNPKAAGALVITDLARPSPAELAKILGPASGDGNGVRTMTLAPEIAGAQELVSELTRSGVRVSLGHSLATAKEARDAARDGACGATHLFNAMPQFHHRDVGLAGFALTDAALYAEIIGDLVHVSAEAMELALRARGPEGLCLVSDALSGAGTGCTHFHSHGRAHEVRDGAAFYPAQHGEPTRLAGSASSQLEMVRKLSSRGVVGLIDALTMASAAPARALGLESERGEFRKGMLADWIVLRGEALELESVWIGGRKIE